jgi:hypothetical protein
MDSVFAYLASDKAMTRQAYPYTGADDQHCRYEESHAVRSEPLLRSRRNVTVNDPGAHREAL